MPDFPWSPRQIALGGFAVGFFTDLFFELFYFDESVWAVPIHSSVYNGYRSGISVFIAYHRFIKE